MTANVVVLGAGTGGTAVANRLRRTLSAAEADITVVDQDARHIYQPGLLFVPFGRRSVASLVRPRWQQLRGEIDWIRAGIDRVDVEQQTVSLDTGQKLDYDVLVVATGTRLLPEETEGLTDPGSEENTLTFYTIKGAAALARALKHFDAGRLVVNVVDTPIKCPVAPLEFCFLADEFFRRRGIRHRVEISYVTPLDGAFTRPIAAKALGRLLERKGIDLVADFAAASFASDGETGTLSSYDGRDVPYDLAVVIPVHGGAEYVGRSDGLGDALDYVLTDSQTLQAKAAPNIFALGDATDLPSSKAGSVAHFESEVLAGNVISYLHDQPLEATYDGHANCFVETGDRKALLIDFNIETEPVPGHFPGPLGLPLLRESRLNHLGKLAFETVYWNAVLPGRTIPGITPLMPRAGKDLSALRRKDMS